MPYYKKKRYTKKVARSRRSRRIGRRIKKTSFKKKVLAITRQEAEKKIQNFDNDYNFAGTGASVAERHFNLVLFNPSFVAPPA